MTRLGRGVVAVAGLCAGLLCCGGGQTRGHPLARGWDDEAGEELADFCASWKPPPPSAAPNLVVGVVDRSTVVGRELPEGEPWRVEHPLAARPAIAGEVVLVLGARQLLALEGRTGRLLWERPAVGKLRGADDDGDLTVVSLESVSGTRSTLLAVDRDGVVVRQLDVPARIGAPAVVAGIAFLPWNDRLVVAFDLRAGRELARIVTASAVSRAWRVGNEVFMGDTTLLHFDPGIVAARLGTSPQLRMPVRDLPGPPRWIARRTETQPVFGEGADRAQMAGRPVVRGPDGKLGFANDRVLGHYDQIAFGLDAENGRTRWVSTGERPWIEAAAAEDGFCLCDVGGAVSCLEARSGALLWRAELEVPLQACTIRIDRILPPTSRQTPAEPAARVERAADSSSRDLVQQLAAALAMRASHLLPIQSELLADLDSLDGDAATAALVALAAREIAAPQLRSEARTRLGRRRTGLAAMADALTAEAERPCVGSSIGPVAELARAVRAARYAPAAAALGRLSQCAALGDTAVALAEALGELAGDEQSGPLGELLARHACGPAEQARVRVVRAAAAAMIRLDRRPVLEALTRQPCVAPALRNEVQRMLEPG